MVTTTDTSRRIAAAVAAALDSAGISTLAAAEGTGIPRTTLNRRLLGINPFNLDELAAIAQLLGVTVDDFLAEGAAA